MAHAEMNQTTAYKAYMTSFAVWLTLHVLLIVGVSMAVGYGLLHGPALYGAAVAAAVPTTGINLAVLRYLSRSDEFVRMLFLRRALIAATLLMAVFTVYGMLQSFAGFPVVPLWSVVPGFWCCFGLVSPFVRSSR